METELGVSIYSQDEDQATAALGNLLRADKVALQSFLAVAGLSNAEQQQPWQIFNQHKTRSGRRIDIFLISGKRSIVVEAKIRSGMHSFQFDPYVHHVVSHETGEMPTLIWLVKKPRELVGELANVARTLTWTHLATTFHELDSIQSKTFAESLYVHGIAEKVPARQLSMSPFEKSSVSLLSKIKSQSVDLASSVEMNVRTPIALRAGRPEWKEPWKKRVWLYHQPLHGLKQKSLDFGFVCHLILYSRTWDEFDAERIRRWSLVMAKHGLQLERNEPGKWNRSYIVSAPVVVETKGLTGVFAKRTVDLVTNFDWQNEEESIQVGLNYLQWGIGIFNECSKATGF